MTSNIRDDPRYLRDRAREMRAVGTQMSESESRDATLKIADSYESLAEAAENRLREGRAG